MPASVTVPEFRVTIYPRSAVGDEFHPLRFKAGVRCNTTYRTLHFTEEFRTHRQASEAAESWVISQGGVIVGRP